MALCGFGCTPELSRRQAAEKIREDMQFWTCEVPHDDGELLATCAVKAGVLTAALSDDGTPYWSYTRTPQFAAAGLQLITCEPPISPQSSLTPPCKVNLIFGAGDGFGWLLGGFSKRAINIEIGGITAGNSPSVRIADYYWEIKADFNEPMKPFRLSSEQARNFGLPRGSSLPPKSDISSGLRELRSCFTAVKLHDNGKARFRLYDDGWRLESMFEHFEHPK